MVLKRFYIWNHWTKILIFCYITILWNKILEKINNKNKNSSLYTEKWFFLNLFIICTALTKYSVLSTYKKKNLHHACQIVQSTLKLVGYSRRMLSQAPRRHFLKMLTNQSRDCYLLNQPIIIYYLVEAHHACRIAYLSVQLWPGAV